MRIGLVCPYQWDVPGGVQYHVRDLAGTLRDLGHEVEVLTPAEQEESLPPHVTFSGRAVPVPYNGSMAGVQFGLVSAARARRWLREGRFDVVHVHEPASVSLSLLVCMIADGPIVATSPFAVTDVVKYPLDLKKAGEMLDGEGGFRVWGKQTPASHSLEAGYLPLGLAHNVKLIADVKAGARLKWSDVEVDANDIAVRTRREMEAAFGRPNG